MNSLTQLDQLNLDTDTRQRVADLVQVLLDQAQQTIHFQRTKIQALTLELAHLDRVRFGKKNEALSALSPKQLNPLEESTLLDIAAIKVEIERIDDMLKADGVRSQRSRAGRQPLPDQLPRIEHWHEPALRQCGWRSNSHD
ncbi:Transposase C of IS166 homeodomain-containing protein [Nitrosomonas cryotolerans]|uniref:Transposase C of IS166 homeodomain-containing protein n=1 Tax=Nitrosomonas cryotolerans ATCC 49181 TaxID=1131553 RepID=A0A1N6FYN0_9PROT|nr:hypothetical protein [Nitrosomonas cryotolerans]SFQ13557.1 Transposase C of IS166 homeodomain-containing protein [Nitrosomonas cryotolerans]SIO00311.1 Transposase C of IS166 homeodomain-containing protein [Nitrosomonas cryotolerans ATCC 49181]